VGEGLEEHPVIVLWEVVPVPYSGGTGGKKREENPSLFNLKLVHSYTLYYLIFARNKILN